MPEYLAPGVYVEETSFRAKSIEGVGTSTAGFVGPAKKGTLTGTPELLTSYADFERIYGGFVDLDFGRNYLAHAVQGFFNEGGSRLYIARAFAGSTDASALAAATAKVDVRPGADAGRVRIVARVPGSGGNGSISISQLVTPVSRLQAERAPQGTLLLTHTDSTPAQATGGVGPFRLTNGSVLPLSVGGANVDLTFRQSPPEAFGTTALPDSVDLTDANTTLHVNVDGSGDQPITMLVAPTPRDQFVANLSQQIKGGYARLSTAGDGGLVNRLVIGTSHSGPGGQVAVSQNGEVGFTAATTTFQTPATDNVADISNVQVNEINSALVAANAAARAGINADGRLVIRTLVTGSAAAIAIRDVAPNTTSAALGLTTKVPGSGTGSAPAKYFVKHGNAFLDDTPTGTFNLADLDDQPGKPGAKAAIVTVGVSAADVDGVSIQYDDLGLSPDHPRFIGIVLAAQPDSRADELANLFAIQVGSAVTPLGLLDALLGGGASNTFAPSGGNDGAIPTGPDYANALANFEQLEDLNIVAAPGLWTVGSQAITDAQEIHNALIAHVEKPRMYRIAVLDTPPLQINSEAITTRSKIDSTRAAIYTPWVVVPNPLARPGDLRQPKEIALPPSGFVAGVYARTDSERGVYKAPANEVVFSALRFERDINFHQQEQLNPLGINCLRFLSGRGYRVWGARTASSDPEWKYVPVRRYFNYLESSIDRGTQWAVFEPNGQRLWGNIRETITDFLYNEWIGGALLGSKPEEAFFVKCDRGTMTQNDLDNGRLICLIGVAVIKPAEFVIFRIGQKTADASS